jgi:pilus assembly protein CpaF
MTRPEPTHTPGALIAEELQMLLRTGRLRTWWDHPPEDAFKGLGIGSDMTPGDWADVNWYGPLEIWRGPEHDVSDILFNGPAHDPFFVVQRGAMVDTGVRVHPDWIAWIQRQLLLRSRKIDPQKSNDWPAPAMQGVADRMRFAITAAPVSRYGGSLSIRLLPETWRTLDDLIQARVLSREAGDLILEALRSGTTVLVAGPTGSGKTTLTAGLTQAIGQGMRLVVIEDGGELPCTHNSLHIEVAEGEAAFSKAVRFALRQKPHYLIVGEVRGGEAMALLQAAATGHPGIGTIHAGSVQGALHNLERMAMIGLAETTGGGAAAASIIRSLIASDIVNLIVIQIGTTSGGRRAVLAVEEVLRQGSQGRGGDPFPTNPLFRYDPAHDTLMRTGYVQSAWGLGRL